MGDRLLSGDLDDMLIQCGNILSVTEGKQCVGQDGIAIGNDSN